MKHNLYNDFRFPGQVIRTLPLEETCFSFSSSNAKKSHKTKKLLCETDFPSRVWKSFINRAHFEHKDE
jgi:hypothetical protein